MAGVVQPMRDVLTKLATLPVVNGDGQAVNMFTRVWNNQIKYEAEGQLEALPKPAAFLEIVNDAIYKEIGIGFRAADLGFRIHVCHEYYNNDGTFEQDLTIFDIRDRILALLALYQPTGCGPMVCVAEVQEYDHPNVYHMILDYIAHYIDSKASWYDPGAGKYIYTTPPINVEIIVDDHSHRSVINTEDGEQILTEDDHYLQPE